MAGPSHRLHHRTAAQPPSACLSHGARYAAAALVPPRWVAGLVPPGAAAPEPQCSCRRAAATATAAALPPLRCRLCAVASAPEPGARAAALVSACSCSGGSFVGLQAPHPYRRTVARCADGLGPALFRRPLGEGLRGRPGVTPQPPPSFRRRSPARASPGPPPLHTTAGRQHGPAARVEAVLPSGAGTAVVATTSGVRPPGGVQFPHRRPVALRRVRVHVGGEVGPTRGARSIRGAALPAEQVGRGWRPCCSPNRRR